MRLRTLRFIVLVALSLAFAVPVAAGAAPRHKRANPDGTAPAKWDLSTPILPSDDSTPTADLGGDGDGTNTIAFGSFDDGDILCAFPGTTFTGHTGIWKDGLHVSDSSYCVWSANTTPANGVQRERASRYRGYDYCYGVWVPSKAAHGLSVVNWCAAQAGEPYDISSSKTDYSRWYCSKLPWAGWKVKTAVDLDADGGYWVKPADLVNDTQTSTFAYSD